MNLRPLDATRGIGAAECRPRPSVRDVPCSVWRRSPRSPAGDGDVVYVRLRFWDAAVVQDGEWSNIDESSLAPSCSSPTAPRSHAVVFWRSSESAPRSFRTGPTSHEGAPCPWPSAARAHDEPANPPPRPRPSNGFAFASASRSSINADQIRPEPFRADLQAGRRQRSRSSTCPLGGPEARWRKKAPSAPAKVAKTATE